MEILESFWGLVEFEDSVNGNLQPEFVGKLINCSANKPDATRTPLIFAALDMAIRVLSGMSSWFAGAISPTTLTLPPNSRSRTL
jgi:hypothetical protein